MARVAVAVAVVIALAAGVWILWPDDESGSTTTQPVAATSTTDIRPTTVPSTTTTTDADHIVDTVEEAEEILRDFWLAWFQAIYNQDVHRLRSLVVADEIVETAREQFGVISFVEEPSRERIRLIDVEILQSDERCLAVWATLDATAVTGGRTDGVQVFRWMNDSWRYTSLWAYRNDLWRDDCS